MSNQHLSNRVRVANRSEFIVYLLLAVTIGAGVSVFGHKNTLVSIGITVGILIWLFSIPRPHFAIVIAVLISSLSGALSSFPLADLPISLSGSLTLLILVSVGSSLVWRLGFRSILRVARSYILFLAFLLFYFIRALTGDTFVEGIRETLLFSAPIILGILSTREMRQYPKFRSQVETLFLLTPAIPIFILVWNILSGTLQLTHLGFKTTQGINVSSRMLAWFLLPFLIVYVAHWRYASNTLSTLVATISSIGLTAIIIGGLSRTASAITLLLVLPSRFVKRITSVSTWIALFIGAILVLYWLSLPQVQARFFPYGVNNLRFSTSIIESIDTQGRRNLWKLVWENSLQSPVIGNGTGSSRVLVYETYPPLEHPHNDYLRVFNDAGLIGLFIFISAWYSRAWKHWKIWRRFEKYNMLGAEYHLAAFLAVMAICLSFLTDNTMVYVFVTIPIFLIFALADSIPVSYYEDSSRP